MKVKPIFRLTNILVAIVILQSILLIAYSPFWMIMNRKLSVIKSAINMMDDLNLSSDQRHDWNIATFGINNWNITNMNIATYDQNSDWYSTVDLSDNQTTFGAKNVNATTTDRQDIRDIIGHNLNNIAPDQKNATTVDPTGNWNKISDIDHSNLSTQQTLIANESSTFCGYFIRSPWDGRLGSQMFVYASFYGMIQCQKKSSKSTFIRVSNLPSSLDAYFENLKVIQRVIPDSRLQNRNMITLSENKCCSYTDHHLENLQCDGKIYYITGYRTSYKYFLHVEAEIKREFKFRESIVKRSRVLFSDSMASNHLNPNKCTIVGAHLRRQDFVSLTDYGHWPAQLDYLKKAVHLYESWYYKIDSNYSHRVMENASRKGHNCLVFLIFGNDYDWNLNATKDLHLLRPNHTHILVMDYRKSHAAVDMCALSMCDHNIISTGTYSWWIGFFSKGTVTYQKEYARLASFLYNQYDEKDYFKPEWIAL